MYAIVEVTTSGVTESKRIGKTVVEERLAACANIIPEISSVYWWKGAVQEDAESILLLKTKAEKVERLIERIRELHSYENPAIIAVPIEKGSPAYLRWIEEETGR
ncbi:MAG: divalent-cation tolerance protein CutA [Methanobacteriota archaeon]|nr:MAG: divalent-cation tolerance protein CutA [Euryarchaeota archaeon]